MGFWAVSPDPTARHRYLFFPYYNVRLRCQKRYLGEILIKKGVNNSSSFDQTPREHQWQKRGKFGDIIAEKANLIGSVVEYRRHNYLQKKRRARVSALGNYSWPQAWLTSRRCRTPWIFKNKTRI